MIVEVVLSEGGVFYSIDTTHLFSTQNPKGIERD